MTQNDYKTVTELPGASATSEQKEMLYTRYTHAAAFAEGKDVLEIACGPGIGLGCLDRKANRTVGGDFSGPLLREAQNYYRGRVPLVRLDAHKLPFSGSCFDVIVFYEAIYYLSDPSVFIDECRRVLRGRGMLLICSANTEWTGFNRSPYSANYFSVSELAALLENHGFSVEPFGAFREAKRSLLSVAISIIRRAAVMLNLVPKSMKGKAFLKRLFYGKAQPLLPELMDDDKEAYPLEPISDGSPISTYKVIYTVCILVH